VGNDTEVRLAQFPRPVPAPRSHFDSEAILKVPFQAAVAWTNSSFEVAVRKQRNPVTLGTEGNGTSAPLRRVGSAGRRNQSGRRTRVEGRGPKKRLEMGKIPAFGPESGQPRTPGNSAWKRMQKHRKPSQMGYISYLPKCKMVVPAR
jgi:hypothetical protein